MQLNDVLKEFIFEISIRNYSQRTQKGHKINGTKQYIEFSRLWYHLIMATKGVAQVIVEGNRKGRKDAL